MEFFSKANPGGGGGIGQADTACAAPELGHCPNGPRPSVGFPNVPTEGVGRSSTASHPCGLHHPGVHLFLQMDKNPRSPLEDIEATHLKGSPVSSVCQQDWRGFQELRFTLQRRGLEVSSVLSCLCLSPYRRAPSQRGLIYSRERSRPERRPYNPQAPRGEWHRNWSGHCPKTSARQESAYCSSRWPSACNWPSWRLPRWGTPRAPTGARRPTPSGPLPRRAGDSPSGARGRPSRRDSSATPRPRA